MLTKFDNVSLVANERQSSARRPVHRWKRVYKARAGSKRCRSERWIDQKPSNSSAVRNRPFSRTGTPRCE